MWASKRPVVNAFKLLVSYVVYITFCFLLHYSFETLNYTAIIATSRNVMKYWTIFHNSYHERSYNGSLKVQFGLKSNSFFFFTQKGWGGRAVLYSHRHGGHGDGTQLFEGAHLTCGNTHFCRKSSKWRNYALFVGQIIKYVIWIILGFGSNGPPSNKNSDSNVPLQIFGI